MASEVYTQLTNIVIPAFHVYGHKMNCQITYGPQQCIGLGKSDGENCERDWSHKAHLVTACCMLSSKSQMMLLEHQSIYFARAQRQKLYSDLERRFIQARTEEIECSALLLQLVSVIYAAVGNCSAHANIESILIEQIEQH